MAGRPRKLALIDVKVCLVIDNRLKLKSLVCDSTFSKKLFTVGPRSL